MHWLNDHFGWVFVGMPQAFNLGSSIESLLISQNECHSSRKHVGFSFKHFESCESLLFHSFWGGNCEMSLWQVFIEVKKMLGRTRAGKLAPGSSSIDFATDFWGSWCHKNDVFFFVGRNGWTINSMNNDWKKNTLTKHSKIIWQSSLQEGFLVISNRLWKTRSSNLVDGSEIRPETVDSVDV